MMEEEKPELYHAAGGQGGLSPLEEAPASFPATPAEAGTNEDRPQFITTRPLLKASTNILEEGKRLPGQGVKGELPLQEALASIPAEAGTSVGRPQFVIPELLPEGVAPHRPRAKRGNPTTQIPPLYYNPTKHTGWIYIVASAPNGHIYIGQTANLPQRAYQHREGLIPGYSKDHNCTMLVYFEGFPRITESIEKETRMKDWPRNWKIRRILETNPTWHDFYTDICP